MTTKPREVAPLEFEFPEDEAFFREVLCPRGGSLARYAFLFDFRQPGAKRLEFSRLRPGLARRLQTLRGRACQLRLPGICTGSKRLTIDHVIPLASNVLNKLLRHAPARPGGKVPSQSFGSNDIRNLVLACRPCNGHKKHRMDKTLVRHLIRQNLVHSRATRLNSG